MSLNRLPHSFWRGSALGLVALLGFSAPGFSAEYDYATAFEGISEKVGDAERTLDALGEACQRGWQVPSKPSAKSHKEKQKHAAFQNKSKPEVTAT